MEVKINREIRNYTESIFFGLSLRQFFFSILACGVAVILYFILKEYLGIETLSWICILGASPFAAIGFIIGTLKVPENANLEIMRKTGGENIDDVILRWIKIKKNGKKIYVYKAEEETKDEQ